MPRAPADLMATPGVYFAQCATRDLIKIGWTSKSYEKRRHHLIRREPAYHDMGDLLALLPNVTQQAEGVIHRKLATDRVKGELFSPSLQVLHIIKLVQTRPEDVAGWIMRTGVRRWNPPKITDGALILEDANGAPLNHNELPHAGPFDIVVRTSRWPICLHPTKVIGPSDLKALAAPTWVTQDQPYTLHVPDLFLLNGGVSLHFTLGEEWRSAYDLAPWDSPADIPVTAFSEWLPLRRLPIGIWHLRQEGKQPTRRSTRLRPQTVRDIEEAEAAIERLVPKAWPLRDAAPKAWPK